MKGLMRRHEPFADMRAVLPHVRETYAGFGPLSDRQWRHLARHSVRRLKDGRYQLAYDPALEASLWNGSDLDMPIGPELVRGVNLWRHWDAIRAPTLILRGGDSDVLPRDVAQEMLGRGPRTQLVEFAGVGHAPALMAEEQIAAIERFLAACRAGPATRPARGAPGPRGQPPRVSASTRRRRRGESVVSFGSI